MKKISAHQIIAENILIHDIETKKNLIQVEISPVDACNHKCMWCFTSSKRTHNYRLSSNKLRLYLNEFRKNGGITIIISGGGEPLLFKNLYNKCEEFNGHSLLEFCIDLGLNIGLITNGLLLNKVYDSIDITKLCFIRVSLDSPDIIKHSTLHQCKISESNIIIDNIRQAIIKRGDSYTPAIGCSFIVDTINSLNDDIYQIGKINAMATIIGLDFIQLKHIHTKNFFQAENTMIMIHQLCLEFEWHDTEFWVQKYLSPKPGNQCYVTELIQSLGNLNNKFPCCHLFGDTSFYTQEDFSPNGRIVEKCPSNVCRYLSINTIVKKIRNHESILKEKKILQHSLDKYGFHPYRLIPTAPDLIFPVRN